MQPTRNQVAAALASIELASQGKPLIEATIGPAEVWGATGPEYRSLAERYCRASQRCQDLANQRNADREMLALVERERDEAAKDARWYRAAAVAAVALAVIARCM